MLGQQCWDMLRLGVAIVRPGLYDCECFSVADRERVLNFYQECIQYFGNNTFKIYKDGIKYVTWLVLCLKLSQIINLLFPLSDVFFLRCGLHGPF